MDVDYDAPISRCGRLDPHEAPHNWSAPQGVGIAPHRVVYLCFGPPVTEGAARGGSQNGSSDATGDPAP